jgi:hypothetical protein
MLLKHSPFRASFTFGKLEKSADAKSGEQGGCWITDQFGSKKLLHNAAQTSNKSSFSAYLFPKFAWPLPY